MKEGIVSVIAVVDSVVERMTVYTDNEDGNKEAEAQFIKWCSEYIWNFDEYETEDITAILDNGYEQWGTGNSINIVHNSVLG